MLLSSLFDKTASKETEDIGPGAAIFERVIFFFFCLIRHFFSPNFKNLPEEAILPKLGFKPFNNGLFQKKKQTGGLRGV